MLVGKVVETLRGGKTRLLGEDAWELVVHHSPASMMFYPSTWTGCLKTANQTQQYPLFQFFSVQLWLNSWQSHILQEAYLKLVSESCF